MQITLLAVLTFPPALSAIATLLLPVVFSLSALNQMALLKLPVGLASSALKVLVPIIVALTAGAFTLFGIWLKSVLGGS
jgi:hypothetical protein